MGKKPVMCAAARERLCADQRSQWNPVRRVFGELERREKGRGKGGAALLRLWRAGKAGPLIEAPGGTPGVGTGTSKVVPARIEIMTEKAVRQAVP
jgi:hypothetical protein